MLKILYRSLLVVLQKKDALFVLFSSTVVIFGSVLLIQKGNTIVSLLNLYGLSLNQKGILILNHLVDFGSSFSVGTLTLAIIGSILGGIYVALAYTYFKTRTKVPLKSGLYGSTGLTLAFLGLGCAACGTAVLSAVLGFFGLSTLLLSLPYEGLEVGYIGLLILGISTLNLADKVVAPNVC